MRLFESPRPSARFFTTFSALAADVLAEANDTFNAHEKPASHESVRLILSGYYNPETLAEMHQSILDKLLQDLQNLPCFGGRKTKLIPRTIHARSLQMMGVGFARDIPPDTPLKHFIVIVSALQN